MMKHLLSLAIIFSVVNGEVMNGRCPFETEEDIYGYRVGEMCMILLVDDSSSSNVNNLNSKCADWYNNSKILSFETFENRIAEAGSWGPRRDNLRIFVGFTVVLQKSYANDSRYYFQFTATDLRRPNHRRNLTYVFEYDRTIDFSNMLNESITMDWLSSSLDHFDSFVRHKGLQLCVNIEKRAKATEYKLSKPYACNTKRLKERWNAILCERKIYQNCEYEEKHICSYNETIGSCYIKTEIIVLKAPENPFGAPCGKSKTQGEQCECDPSNMDCLNNGTKSTANKSNVICLCPSGWSGKLCEEKTIEICGRCKNSIECKDNKCICKKDYTGRYCTIQIEENMGNASAGSHQSMQGLRNSDADDGHQYPKIAAGVVSGVLAVSACVAVAAHLRKRKQKRKQQPKAMKESTDSRSNRTPQGKGQTPNTQGSRSQRRGLSPQTPERPGSLPQNRGLSPQTPQRQGPFSQRGLSPQTPQRLGSSPQSRGLSPQTPQRQGSLSQRRVQSPQTPQRPGSLPQNRGLSPQTPQRQGSFSQRRGLSPQTPDRRGSSPQSRGLSPQTPQRGGSFSQGRGPSPQTPGIQGSSRSRTSRQGSSSHRGISPQTPQRQGSSRSSKGSTPERQGSSKGSMGHIRQNSGKSIRRNVYNSGPGK